ncbi:MAG: DUF4404 family protein [Porticoccaceae bacterium]|nr:DUF4404 family protein [Porticoccaceae bacterium]
MNSNFCAIKNHLCTNLFHRWFCRHHRGAWGNKTRGHPTVYTFIIRLCTKEEPLVDNSELTAALELLRERLQKASTISSAERDLLSSLITDMTQGDDSDDPQEDPPEQSFRELLQSKASSYEVDHPELAYLMRQVLDILTKMGI